MATTDRLDGVSGDTAVKNACIVATTANITLSGLQTIDSVAVVAADRVLVKNQTTGSENGIYVVSATAWTRAKDCNGARDIVKGTRVYCFAGGSVTAGEYILSTASPVVGTTTLTFAKIGGAGTGDVSGPGISVDNEIALFNSTTGGLIKRASGTGYVKSTSGVISNVTTIPSTDITGLGTASTLASAALLQKDNNLSEIASASTSRTNLGLTIGTNVQAYSANLAAVAAVTVTAAGTALLDDATASDQRTTLGLGTLATQSGTFSGTSSGTNTGDQTTVSGNAGTATALATARAIYGNNFDGTAALTQIIASTYGGTGNGFAKFSGPSSSEKTFTLPNASDTVACLGTVGAYTAQQNFTAGTLTSSGASIAWNLATAQSAKHTFTENTTLANPTNMVDGGTYILKFTQHASSPKTLAFGNAYKTPGGVAFVISATNSAIDILTFVSDGASMYMVGQKAFA
jgi:hypothetical protein